MNWNGDIRMTFLTPRLMTALCPQMRPPLLLRGAWQNAAPVTTFTPPSPARRYAPVPSRYPDDRSQPPAGYDRPHPGYRPGCNSPAVPALRPNSRLPVRD